MNVVLPPPAPSKHPPTLVSPILPPSLTAWHAASTCCSPLTRPPWHAVKAMLTNLCKPGDVIDVVALRSVPPPSPPPPSNHLPLPPTLLLHCPLLQHGCLICVLTRASPIAARSNFYDKGQAFIVMKNVEQAAAALKKLDGYELQGKNITVSYAKSKSHAVEKLEGIFAVRGTHTDASPRVCLPACLSPQPPNPSSLQPRRPPSFATPLTQPPLR